MNDLIDAIAKFTPDEAGWLPLDRLLSELAWGALKPKECQRLCFLFERYPEEDNEIFWGLLHGLEGVSGYGERVLASVKHRPSLMTVLMLNRMINAGQHTVAGIDLLAQIRCVAAEREVPESIRNRARKLIDYQREKSEGTTNADRVR